MPYGDGIRMAAAANTVEGNVVTFNGSNGITVLHKQQQVRRNTARFNGQRPGPFPTYDLNETNFACDGNAWSANRGGTGSHACVLA